MTEPTEARASLLGQLEFYRAKMAAGDDRSAVEETLEFVRENPRCADRELASGHLTGSAWIVDAERRQTLLTHHRKLGKWLQLGGHADGDFDLLRVALREAQEESGISDFKVLCEGIFDVDKHWIPARVGEPAHWHFDLRFLLEADSAAPLVLTKESKALAWIDLVKLPSLTSEESVLRMWRKSKLKR